MRLPEGSQRRVVAHRASEVIWQGEDEAVNQRGREFGGVDPARSRGFNVVLRIEGKHVLGQRQSDLRVADLAVVNIGDAHDHAVEAVLRPDHLDAGTGNDVPRLAIDLGLARRQRIGCNAQIAGRQLHREVSVSDALILVGVGHHAALNGDVREVLGRYSFSLLGLRVRPRDDDLVDRFAPKLALEIRELGVRGIDDRQVVLIVVAPDQLHREEAVARVHIDDTLDIAEELRGEFLDGLLRHPKERDAELLVIERLRTIGKRLHVDASGRRPDTPVGVRHGLIDDVRDVGVRELAVLVGDHGDGLVEYLRGAAGNHPSPLNIRAVCSPVEAATASAASHEDRCDAAIGGAGIRGQAELVREEFRHDLRGVPRQIGGRADCAAFLLDAAEQVRLVDCDVGVIRDRSRPSFFLVDDDGADFVDGATCDSIMEAHVVFDNLHLLRFRTHCAPSTA